MCSRLHLKVDAMPAAPTPYQLPSPMPERNGFWQQTLADMAMIESPSDPKPEEPAVVEGVEVEDLIVPSRSVKRRAERSGASPARSKKLPPDTVEGCRERASADSALASKAETRNGQLRLEHSAASWAKRGDLLQRMNDSFQARSSAFSASAARL